jgi:hypothetical protein
MGENAACRALVTVQKWPRSTECVGWFLRRLMTKASCWDATDHLFRTSKIYVPLICDATRITPEFPHRQFCSGAHIDNMESSACLTFRPLASLYSKSSAGYRGWSDVRREFGLFFRVKLTMGDLEYRDANGRKVKTALSLPENVVCLFGSGHIRYFLYSSIPNVRTQCFEIRPTVLSHYPPCISPFVITWILSHYPS